MLFRGLGGSWKYISLGLISFTDHESKLKDGSQNNMLKTLVPCNTSAFGNIPAYISKFLHPPSPTPRRNWLNIDVCELVTSESKNITNYK